MSITFLFLSFTLLSCSYETTVVNLNSLWDSTWDFNSSSNYIYDKNSIEVVNGKANLKTLDLEHSGDDFNSGIHMGSGGSAGKIKLLGNSTEESTHVNSAIPSQSTSLVGYWRFDNNFKDSSINSFTGVNNGATLNSDSKIGVNSASFNGTSDYIELPNNSKLNTNTFTVSFWAKVEGGSGSYRSSIASRDGGSGGNLSGYLFYAGANDQWQFWVGTGTAWAYILVSDIPVSNDWIHIVGSYNGSQLKLYADGVLAKSLIGSFQVNSNRPLRIGAGATEASPNYFYNGKLDEVAIWSTALTDSEVSSLYINQSLKFTELSPAWTPKWDNIVGYWKMDGNWQDSSGNGNHGVATGDATFSPIAQVGSNSGELDGAGDSVTVTDDSSFDFGTGDFTLSSWIKTSDTLNRRLALGKYGGSGTSYWIGIDTGGFPIMALTGTTVVGGTPVEISSWYHLVGLRRDGQLYLYLNGDQIGMAASAGIASPGGDLSLGNFTASSSFGWQGELDEISVWNNGLSNTEVKLIYNRQKQKYAGSYDSEVIDLGTATSTWPDLSWSTSLPFGKELVGDFDNDGNPDSESSSDYSGLSGDLSNGLVGYWTFNEKSLNSGPLTTDFRDSSGSNLHLDESFAVEHNSIGKINQSILLDGVDDFVGNDGDISPLLNHSSGTISVWFKASSDNNSASLFSISDSSNYISHRIEIFVGETTSSYTDESLCFILVNSGLTDLTFCTREGTTTYFDSKWRNVVIRIDGVDNAIFIDGIKKISHFLQGAVSTSNFSTINGSNVNFKIGKRNLSGTAAAYFSGKVDETSVWSRGLSDTEVQQLYRRGANRVKLQVKSCVDSSCICESFNAAPVGSATDCDGDGILNTADTDDDFKSEFIGPGGDGTTYYSELYNRETTEMTFDCALNITDSDAGVCAADEVTLSAGPKPTGPEFLNINYTQFVKPPANQFIQYRVYMEADDNIACDGEPCLPELLSVNLNPSNVTKYSGGPVEIKPTNSITYKTIKSVTIDADTCATYQLSNDGTNYYYWDGTTWAAVAIIVDQTTKLDFENHIADFATQFGPGKLFIKSFLKSNLDQTTNCTINNINVDYSN